MPIFFAQYQPVLDIPPFKQNTAHAEFTQDHTIDPSGFAEAFQLPHPGYLSQGFRSYHPAVDIATGIGMPVHPISKGVIIEATYSYFGLGHYVVVEHEQNIRSTYGHMGRMYVKKGDQVTAETIMGEVGMTGRTTGPHTHLEVTRDGHYINPLTLLPPLPQWPEYAGSAPQGQKQEVINTIKQSAATTEPEKEIKAEEQKESSKLDSLLINLGPVNGQNNPNNILETNSKLPRLLASQ